ncbi:MAG: hypothetical protein IPH24_07390 [Crocinitomicaceae bacterium]|nr:hypothetical protein [Crocinitomicaceae bacterium]
MYSLILTNDFEKSTDDVVFFYNNRGAIEREYEVLKYDFGWNKLPFSKLAENNVYLLVTAMCKNIYHYLINHFSKTVLNLKPNFRLKNLFSDSSPFPQNGLKNPDKTILIFMAT